jgi:soluble lytic murein transglycosylase-like protein
MKKYHSDVAAIASDNGLPPELVHAVIAAESAYNPSAISPMGAVGLMQLMPATAQRFGVKNSYSPIENIRGGCSYLRYLMGLFDGNLSLVLAAYNAGEGAVQKYGNTIPPYVETQNYVKKVRYFHRIFSQQTG